MAMAIIHIANHIPINLCKAKSNLDAREMLFNQLVGLNLKAKAKVVLVSEATGG